MTETSNPELKYYLSSPEKEVGISVETALEQRRSHRSFQDRELSAEQLSQILWAAYGITMPAADIPSLRGGFRTTPSAGALYPLEIYAVVGNVTGVDAGVYKYNSGDHSITLTVAGDIRDELADLTFGQDFAKEAPITVVYAAVFERLAERYGQRGVERYAYIELGHSAQNIYLQAESLGLGTCAVGAFADDRLSVLLDLPEEEAPLYLMPVGYVSYS